MTGNKKSIEQIFHISPTCTDEMFTLIADESDTGAARLAKIMLLALASYSFIGARRVEIATAIEQIKNMPLAHQRLPVFKKIISTGGWESTSYNVYLFSEFIKELGAYDELKDNGVIYIAIKCFRSAVQHEIDRFMKDYEVKQKRKEELKALRPIRYIPATQAADMSMSPFKKLNLILDPVESNEELIKKDSCSTFVLRRTEEQSNLYWINSWGAVNEIPLKNYEPLTDWLKGNPSPLSEELVLELKQHLLTVETKSALNSKMVGDMSNRLAAVFGQESKEKKPLTATINVQFADAETDAALVAQGVRKTFIVRQSESPSLTWINEQGEIKSISFAKYPKLSEWLITHKNETRNAHMEELQALLLRVKTIDESKQNILGLSLASMFTKPRQPKQNVNNTLPAEGASTSDYAEKTAEFVRLMRQGTN